MTVRTHSDTRGELARKRQPPRQPKQETIELCRELRKIERWTVRVTAERANPAIIKRYVFEGRGSTLSAAMGQARKRLSQVMKSDPLFKYIQFSDRGEALTLERVADIERWDHTKMEKAIYWLDDPTKPVGRPRKRIAQAAALRESGWSWQRLYDRFEVPKGNPKKSGALRGEAPETPRAVFRSRVKAELRRKRRKYHGAIERLKKLFPGPFPYLYQVTINFVPTVGGRPHVYAHRSILPFLRAHNVTFPTAPTGGA